MRLLLLAPFAIALAQPPQIRVDTGADRHAISKLIYGINEMGDADSSGRDQSLLGRVPFTARRWGGDNSVAYNWKLDADNTAGNWFFETFPKTKLKPAIADDLGLPAGTSFEQWVARNQKAGVKSLATVPIIGWTVNSNRAKDCAFSVRKYGPQKQTDVYAPDCGTGVKTDGKTNVVNDPNDVYMEVGPDFAQEWVATIAARYGSTDKGGVFLWELDNEPTWWHAVHRDIHPQFATFAEVLDRNIRWAKAIKAADPTALVGGATPPGWESYFYSAADLYAGWGTGPDYKYWNNPSDCKASNADGSCDGFLPWYLRKMREQEEQGGVRLMDYLDIHAYVGPDGLPEAYQAAKPEVEKLRMTSTRIFWDPDYMPAREDMRGMNRKWGTGTPQIVPRMKKWIGANYPGTKLAITEYNWGALDKMTGAIAQADLLGIFGREGVDLATIWASVPPASPAAFAWRMFLDYDGQGTGFGTVSVQGTTTDADTVSVFASENETGTVTVLLLNKSREDIEVPFEAPGLESRPIRVWRYSDANLKQITQGDDVNWGEDQRAKIALPALSMTMLVLPN